MFKEKVTINNKNIYFRKWKVKDKNKFLKNKDDAFSVKSALVYDCMKNPNALNDEEYKYMLVMIRDRSIKQPVEYEFVCKCSHKYPYTLDLSKTFVPIFDGYKPIIIDDLTICTQPLQNQEFYNEKMMNCSKHERSLFDFILHIKSVNDNEEMNFEELLDFINEMELDIFEETFKAWSAIKFKVNMTDISSCPKCGKEQLYEFDDLPNFFTELWD